MTARITLAIDASTYVGSVAVFREREVVTSGTATMRGADTEALMPAVIAALERAGVTDGRVDRVVCGAGPGSFTSLRIAAGIAKGIAFATGVPLYPASSLGLCLAAALAAPGRYVVTLDALRDEWYAGVWVRDVANRVTEERAPVRVAKTDLEAFAADVGAPVIGGAGAGELPNAAGCAALFDTIDAMGPVDLDRWEPAYGRLAEAQVKWEAAHGRPLET